jgi:hypothetical protein
VSASRPEMTPDESMSTKSGIMCDTRSVSAAAPLRRRAFFDKTNPFAAKQCRLIARLSALARIKRLLEIDRALGRKKMQSILQ